MDPDDFNATLDTMMHQYTINKLMNDHEEIYNAIATTFNKQVVEEWKKENDT